MSVVIDASVWVSAADASDSLSATSRRFLEALVRRRTPVLSPAHTYLEVACALARRLQNDEAGRAIAEGLLRFPQTKSTPLDSTLIREALELGTAAFLRAGDALYAAVARRESAALVAWDAELIQRAGAVTPQSWLESHA